VSEQKRDRNAKNYGLIERIDRESIKIENPFFFPDENEKNCGKIFKRGSSKRRVQNILS